MIDSREGNVYKVTDPSLTKVTKEIEYMCTEQIKALSVLGGRANLRHFGVLRPFVQTYLASVRDNIHNTRKGAIRSALNAVSGEYVREFDEPLNVKLQFENRQYSFVMKSRHK